MKFAISVVALLMIILVSSVSLADEILFPPWDSCDHFHDGFYWPIGWEIGYEDTTSNYDIGIGVNHGVTVIGESHARQECWHEIIWQCPNSDWYTFSYDYDAIGMGTISGASYLFDGGGIAVKVELFVLDPELGWGGPALWWCEQLVCLESKTFSDIDYSYNVKVHIPSARLHFEEGTEVILAAGLRIDSFCVAGLGSAMQWGVHAGALNYIDVAADNQTTPLLRVSPDPPSHAFGEIGRNQEVEWTFNVWNGGTGSLDWIAYSDSYWIEVSPSSGQSTGECDSITISVETTDLSLGPHSGSLFIDAGSAGSRQGFISVEIINMPPGADAGGPYSGTAGEDITFDASGSVDLDGTITGYRWDWDNDGTWDTDWSSSPTATHSFPASGSYTVCLEAKDNDGDTNWDTCVANIDLYSTVVYPDGSGDYPTIQAAIDAVSEGAVILLGDGMFMGDGNRDIDYNGKAITVRSLSDNPETCIINCQGSEEDPHRGFYFHSEEGSNSVLQGVTICNGYAEHYGGGIYCHYMTGATTPTITNCTVTGCFSGNDGGGIYGGRTFTNCTISGNSSGSYGGGIYGGRTFTNCTISGNTSDYAGGGVYIDSGSSSPVFKDCQISGNVLIGESCSEGGGMFYHGNGYACLTLTNVTFSDNSVYPGPGGGLYVILGGPDNYATLTNVTFSGNSAHWGAGMGSQGDGYVILENCTFRYNSASSLGGGLDCRTSGSITDGLFVENSSSNYGGGVFCWSASPSLQNCTFSENSAGVYGAGICAWDNAAPTLENVIIAFATQSAGIYCDGGSSATLTCCDIYGNAGGDWVDDIEDQYGINGNISEDPLFCDPENGDYHIMDASPCAPDYNPSCGLIGALGVNCWQEFFTVPGDYPTIQAAIDAASDHAIIELTESAYIGPGNRDIDYLGKKITVRSQTGIPKDCIIDCMGNSRGFNFVSGEGSNSVLEGVTIINGSSDIGGGILCSYSSPTITRCVIESNAASIEGAGVYCDHASPTLINCQITNNEASVRGGALMCYNSESTLTITNCTISDNWAGTEGGGMFLASSSPTLTNCILWDDSPDEIYILYSSDLVVTYCDVQGGWSGEGNIDEDPRRFGCKAYHLQYGSPCIDAGDPEYVPDSGETDIDGETRIMRGRVDMGSDEIPNPPRKCLLR